MIPAVKEYNDVLILARGLVSETLAQTADGFQVQDLIPILSENMSKAMAAYAGGELIPQAFKENLKDCIDLSIDFVIDVACDLLKLPAGGEAPQFKETEELVAAVNGIAGSVIKYLPGGIDTQEIMPIVFENFQNILVGAEGVDKIGGELKADTRAFLRLVVHASVDMAFNLKEAFENRA